MLAASAGRCVASAQQEVASGSVDQRWTPTETADTAGNGMTISRAASVSHSILAADRGRPRKNHGQHLLSQCRRGGSRWGRRKRLPPPQDCSMRELAAADSNSPMAVGNQNSAGSVADQPTDAAAAAAGLSRLRHKQGLCLDSIKTKKNHLDLFSNNIKLTDPINSINIHIEHDLHRLQFAV